VRYTVVFLPPAVKSLGSLPYESMIAVDQRALALADEPRPTGMKKLVGEEGLYRVRQGVYRIVYTIDDANERVVIKRIDHRREIYR
jgi:mRNA interferase RelE/StbE